MDDTNPDTIPMFKKGIKKRIIKASTIFLNLNTSTDFLTDIVRTSFISIFFF